MPPLRRLPVALMEELVEEILLRFPPDDPARLFRAALVCKAWCRLISGPAFHLRFRELHRHRTPPLLGLICRRGSTCPGGNLWTEKTHFMPTSTFGLPSSTISSWRTIDTLHGRILFWDKESVQEPSACWEFVVRNPIARELWRLPMLCLRGFTWSAKLLCATVGCDHLDCSSGAFTVVLVGTDLIKGLTSVYVYSSEKHVWRETTSIQHLRLCVSRGPGALDGETVYFQCEYEYWRRSELLAYECSKQELSFVSLPESVQNDYSFIALTTEDEGKIGLAMAQGTKLFTWSRKAGLDGDAGCAWTQQRVFDLRRSCGLSGRYEWFAATGSHGVFVVKVHAMLFGIDLHSGRVTTLLEDWTGRHVYDVVPYICYCIPCFVCPIDI